MLPGTKPPRRRDAIGTRRLLLQAAFREVYKSGFQGTDIDTIIRAAGVTKGALYHHFASKEALGYAIVDEVVTEITLEKWVRPLQNPGDPIAAIIAIIDSTSLAPDDLRGGCPLNNLAQEMSPLDEGFRKRIDKVFGDWLGAIAGALRDGQKHGLVRDDIDPNDIAGFVIATYEGYISLTKSSQDPRMLESGKRNMARYLGSLRAPQKRKLRSSV